MKRLSLYCALTSIKSLCLYGGDTAIEAICKKRSKDLLEILFSARNLLPVNKKTTATNGGSFAGIKSYQLFFPKVTGLVERRYQILSF